MNSIDRTKLLLEAPCSAKVIQVATLIRQAISAQSVVVFSAGSSLDDDIQLFWSDPSVCFHSPTGSRDQQVFDRDAFRARLKIITDLFSINQSSSGMQHVRFLRPGFGCEEKRLREDRIQAIYWQVQVGEKTWFFLWEREKMNMFSPEDRQDFQRVRPQAYKQLISDSWSNSGRHSKDPNLFRTPIGPSVGIKFTPAQQKVLDLLVQGKTEKEIAKSLERSPNTIHVHIKAIYQKLAVHSRAELRQAVRSMVK